jgi:2-hydroxy-3-keto-5-methylthiopentenyl-1-phosphate phosphatase
MAITHGPETPRHFLVASDFDQTLSFNDSGIVLGDLLGVPAFESKVDGLRRSNLVHQGGELAYLIRHDPEFRSVRREHLVEAGRRVRLKNHIPELVDFLANGIEGFRFSFFVVSAAPREVIESALEGVVPADHIFGTEFDYDEASGEIRSVRQVPAGYGKVEVLEGIERRLGVSPERTVYVGDGSSTSTIATASRLPCPRISSCRASRSARSSATARSACSSRCCAGSAGGRPRFAAYSSRSACRCASGSGSGPTG